MARTHVVRSTTQNDFVTPIEATRDTVTSYHTVVNLAYSYKMSGKGLGANRLVCD